MKETIYRTQKNQHNTLHFTTKRQVLPLPVMTFSGRFQDWSAKQCKQRPECHVLPEYLILKQLLSASLQDLKLFIIVRLQMMIIQVQT